MRKIILSFILALPFSVMAQKKTDTVILKNGQTIAGYIYKMEGNAIYVATTKDSVVYKADEVQTLMFCHEVRSKKPCKTGGSSSSYSSSSGKNSYSSNEETKTNKGMLQISCNQCGGRVTLKIWAEFGNTKIDEMVQTDIEQGESFFSHKTWLEPGEYNWSYTDTNKNRSSGKVVIKKGEKHSIILFEKE
jgi:hypothetical protein